MPDTEVTASRLSYSPSVMEATTPNRAAFPERPEPTGLRSLPRRAWLAVSAAWVVFLRATFQSLGVLGLLLGTAFFAALVWLLVDFGLLATDSVSTMAWVTMVCLALLLAIGMSWSHVRRRMTGQVDVDDVEGGR